MSDQAPPSEHDQLAYLVEVEIPALEAENVRFRVERDTLREAAERVMIEAHLTDACVYSGAYEALKAALAPVPEQAKEQGGAGCTGDLGCTATTHLLGCFLSVPEQAASE